MNGQLGEKVSSYLLMSPIVFRNGSSIVTYVIQYGSPVTELERSLTAAELTNAIDATTNTFTIGGVPVPVKGKPVLLVNSNNGSLQEGNYTSSHTSILKINSNIKATHC